jgi:nucleoside 2-deoxyribosyltransferase
LIVNPDGYIGTSTTLEMGYAVALAKPMFSWEPDTAEVSRDILMISVDKNIDNLVSYLK